MLGEAPLIDARRGEVARVAYVAYRQSLSLGDQVIANLVPHAACDVCPGGRRALLSGVLERAPDQRCPQHVRISAGMGDHEVLAPGLPDQPRVAAVAADVGPDRLPEVLEGLGRPGEVDPGKVG